MIKKTLLLSTMLTCVSPCFAMETKESDSCDGAPTLPGTFQQVDGATSSAAEIENFARELMGDTLGIISATYRNIMISVLEAVSKVSRADRPQFISQVNQLITEGMRGAGLKPRNT